ncbi:uncharacterized protein PV09_09394 [Verruconis gallopava]|uniref:SCP domain-containing protein n=1 Tax=Verruconis gallopava TaxID=253628 RepID=A0A0D2AIV1_9PEZI|nr:uncharacterized protein PV09_09394 [Verruconis gallopava]KIV98868.1 hypothetical protein PV09_09394 [Verruconis gallopava]
MLTMIFFGILAAACAFPQHWGKISAGSIEFHGIYPSFPGAQSPATSIQPISSFTQLYETTSAAFHTAVSSSSPASAPPTGYSATVVAHHNAHRTNHSAPEIAWDDGLAATAQKIAESCTYAHDTSIDGGGYGQNIAAGTQSSEIGSVITDIFYNNEVSNFEGLYGEATPSSIDDEAAFNSWGHFTQLVWASSNYVGCATVDCSASGLANTGSFVPPYFTVCNYKPAGNLLDQFNTNVRESLNRPSISGDSQF